MSYVWHSTPRFEASTAREFAKEKPARLNLVGDMPTCSKLSDGGGHMGWSFSLGGFYWTCLFGASHFGCDSSPITLH